MLWNYGAPLEVTWPALARLLASPGGAIIIGRRLDAPTLRDLTSARSDFETEVHAHVINDEEARWKPAGRGTG